MAQIIEESNTQQPVSQNQQADLGLGGLGNAGNGDAPISKASSNATAFDLAFGFKSNNSNAAQFVASLNELKKTNPQLGNFYYGTFDQVSGEMGSMAYVAGEYNGALLFGTILFEHDASIRVTINNNQEGYYTVASLITEDVVKEVAKVISANHGVQLNAIHFMAMNVVPEMNTQRTVDPQWAALLLGQLMLSIFGRAPGFLGEMVPRQEDRFTFSVGAAANGVKTVLDVNGVPHRADFVTSLQHMQAKNNNTTPTLMDAGGGDVYPAVHGAGYVNMRYTGIQQQQNPGQLSLRQMQAEVVVSCLDSQSGGSSRTPIQRQLAALAGFAELASNGGWRELAIRGFDKSARKLSVLAAHLNWGGQEVDVSKLDNEQAVAGFLDTFCYPTAAVVMNHRAGNGIAGLSTLMSEVARNNTSSLRQLLTILDRMFPKLVHNGSEVNFTQYMAMRNGLKELQPGHFIAAAVPTVAGAYTGSTGLASYEDLDLVAVANYIGDKTGEMMDFIRAQSLNARDKGERDQRIYLMKLAGAILANHGPRPVGEELQMAVAPMFLDSLRDAFKSKAQLQVVGVSAFNAANNSLITGGQVTVLGGSNGLGSNNDFGLGALGGSFSF